MVVPVEVLSDGELELVDVVPGSPIPDQFVVEQTPEQRIARLEARVNELEVETAKLTTEREVLQRAVKCFAGETRW